jgi:hypothetical protein
MNVKSFGLLDIKVGMIDARFGEVTAYNRIADQATIIFSDGTVKHINWDWRFFPKEI